MTTARETLQFSTVVKHDHPIVRDHRVHDVRILPGVTYLDLLYRLMNKKGVPTADCEVRNILFQKPVAVSPEFSQKVRLTLTPNGDGWSLRGESCRLLEKDGTASPWEETLQGEVALVAPKPERRIDLDRLRASARKVYPIDRAYAHARDAGIMHQAFMKEEGTLFLGDDWLLAELTLSDAAQRAGGGFHLHPAHLDGATLVSVFPETRTFVPLHIKAFRAAGALGDRCFAFVDRAASLPATDDLCFSSLDLFDTSGVWLAELRGLTAKRIRHKELMLNLQAVPNQAATAPATPELVPPSSTEVMIAAATAEDQTASLQQEVIERIAQVRGCRPSEIDIRKGFYEQGLDSTHLLKLVRVMEELLGVQLYPTLLFEYTTVATLSEYLAKEYGQNYRGRSERGKSSAPAEVPAELVYGRPVWWEGAPDRLPATEETGATLVFGTTEFVSAIVERPGRQIIRAVFGAAFAVRGENAFELNPRHPADCDRLLTTLQERGIWPARLLSLGAEETPNPSDFSGLDAGLYPIFNLAKAFLRQRATRPLKLLHVFAGGSARGVPLQQALSGFLRTVYLENPKFLGRVLELEGLDRQQSLRWIRENQSQVFKTEFADLTEGGRHVCWRKEKRYVQVIEEFSPPPRTEEKVLRQRGVYLITGGAGGLGYVFAEHLARSVQARLVLCGRSELTTAIEGKLEHLRELGAEAIYVPTDVTDADAVRATVARAQTKFGALNGVLHCAGTVRDALLPEKTREQVDEVLAAKVRGTLIVDEATKDQALDLFVLFSSVSGLRGNAGQSDYAYGNAFMDRFAEVREIWRSGGLRRGRTHSIGWPFWADGGMIVDAESRDAFKTRSGMTPLRTESGLAAFTACIHSDVTHLIVAEGEPKRLRRWLEIEEPSVAVPSVASRPAAKTIASAEPEQNDLIAIVGLAGRYPLADNLDTFWENLKNGRDCIREVPTDRWNHADWFDARRGVAGKAYSKWGSFLDDIDKFDPCFFGITPREAELMDPQERLFLETAWHGFEDAGYTRATLSGESVGVYVGAMWSHYQLWGWDQGEGGSPLTPGSLAGSIANRVSYLLDLKGPSLTLDTMCSSSLTALHLACDSLRNGDCTMALAGGVNLSLHPAKYLFLSRGNFASSDGRCRSFGEGGDGYVPGEGVGAVVLKPLSRALADGDLIYAVIRATAVSHGGRTSGQTVPSPIAQGDLIKKTLLRAGVDPQTISYIEAHGTGTSLGDPIEIAGLNHAFKGPFPSGITCAIGSVKSNIGHLESGAGIAGLTKVLLQMRHRQLVPSLHADALNPHINFATTPFRIQRELGDWKSSGDGIPRRAGLSAFGAGGTNAHVILEERARSARAESRVEPHLFVLSARTPERLTALARQLADFVDRWLNSHERQKEAAFADIAYTLQVGRETWEERLAIVAETGAELRTRLQAFAAKGEESTGVFRGTVTTVRADLNGLLDGREGEAFLQIAVEDRKLSKLAALWAAGREFDWNRLHQGERPRRVSLPGYPFARERTWLPSAPAVEPVVAENLVTEQLHPLVHRNVSTLREQKFSSRLEGSEFFLSDHRWGDEKLLPGAAILEMAFGAGRVAGERKVRRIQQATWAQPICVNGHALDLEIRFSPNGVGAYYRIITAKDQIHAQGKVLFEGATHEPSVFDWRSVAARLTERVDGKTFYLDRARSELKYGPSFHGIQEVRYNAEEALAWIVLPAHLETDFEKFTLHPSLLDSAFQTVIALLEKNPAGDEIMFLPFSLDELELLRPLPKQFIAHARLERATPEFYSFSLQLGDEQGHLCARLKNFVLRATNVTDAPRKTETLYFEETWRPAAATSTAATPTSGLLLFSANPQLAESLSRWAGPVVRVEAGDHFLRKADDVFVVQPDSVEDAERLLTTLQQSNALPRAILHAWALDPRALKIETGLQTGLWANFALAKALTRLGLAGDRRIVSVYPGEAGDEAALAHQAVHAAVAGFARTVEREHPGLRWQTVEVAADRPITSWAEALWTEVSSVTPTGEIRLDQSGRCVRELVEVTPSAPTYPAFRDRGVYLITGGAVGLGLLFAQDLAANYQARLVLVGRSPLDAEKEMALTNLRTVGGEAIYIEADISDPAQATRAVEAARKQFGALHGVLHSAGVLADARLFRKTREQVERVIAPKVHGALNLDAATRGDALECFILFSSVSALRGNVGQCDYAFANRFLDRFAAGREALRQSGQRAGRTLSINWPMWAAGGMRVGDDVQRLLAAEYGLHPMPVPDGLAALTRVAGGKMCQVLVVHGEPARLRAWLAPQPLAPTVTTEVTRVALAAPVVQANPGTIDERELAERLLRELISVETRLPADRLRPDKPFEDYGIDSVMIVNLNRALEQRIGEIPKTLFFEYQTLAALTDYLVREQRPALIALGAQQKAARTDGAVAQTRSSGTDQPVAMAGRFMTETAVAPHDVAEPSSVDGQDIAIVGLAGRYPQAGDLEAFWENLRLGRDSVTEVPLERWDYRRWFDADKNHKGTIYSKWGSFIDGATDFDPAFFKISPREARLIDPQERLFLETAWHALEDAGIPPNHLSGRRAGVFAGAMYGHYQLFAEEARQQGVDLVPNSSFANISNRVSYSLNLRGPSLTLDTMCSSSLTAIHLACDSLRRGEIEVALAGGVNLSIHPQKYLELSQAKFASSDGRCRTFGAGGDGYVPGEGVGIVVLKRLHQALADGDQIHAVIKASVLNHGGKTNGYTVPNPVAQGELVAEALQAARLTPEAITYIEAHGTGTSLGDPIEINGLERAFGTSPQSPHTCALGSVKSNIGHLEAAAGIAGLTKVLLQLRHGAIAPSLHSKELNPNIQFETSRFFVPQVLTPWKPSADGRRRAGISSFGAGGANAHLIIEEFVSARPPTKVSGPQVFVLSARSEERLREYTARFSGWLRAPVSGSRPGLGELAYTSQTGREAMAFRLATVVDDLSQLGTVLARYSVDGTVSGKTYLGRVSTEGDDPVALRPALNGDPSTMARAWAEGSAVDWSSLYGAGENLRRVSMPQYPFVRKRCWILPDSPAAVTAEPVVGRATATVETPHTPLPADLLYVPRWQAAPLVATTVFTGDDRPVLVVVPPDAADVEAALASVLAVRSETVVLGKENRRLPSRRWEVNTRDAGAWEQVLSQVQSSNRVVFLGALTREIWPEANHLSELAHDQERGVWSLFRLVKALAARGALTRPLELTVVIDGAQSVHSGEPLQPGGASTLGLCKVLAREYPQLTLRCVDLGWKRWERAVPTAELEQGFRSIFAEAPQHSGEEIAWRQGLRYVRTLVPLDLAAAPAEPWKREGVYLIVGGAGGLGLEFCRHLAISIGAKVALIGRSALQGERLATFNAIATAGGQVQYLRADLTQYDELRAAVLEVERTFGPIAGAIHSAIVLDDKTIESMDESVFRRVFDPKVIGSAILQRALADQPLDFLLFFSSVQALTGNAGQGNYVAGCAFKDAYAHYLQTIGRCDVRTINWGYWGSVGVVATPEYRARLTAQGIGSIESTEGIEVARRVLGGGPGQVIAMKVEPRVLERMGVERAQRALHGQNASRALWLNPDLLRAASDPSVSSANFETATVPLDRLARDLLIAQLRKMGAFSETARRFTVESWAQQLKVVARHRPLLHAIVPLLKEMGAICPVGTDSFTLRDPQPSREVTEEELHEVETLQPELAAHARLVWQCLQNYPRILRGEIIPTEVLFPHAGVNLLEGVYRRNRIADHYNGIVARGLKWFLERLLSARPPGQPLRVLEIGAGTGGTTAVVLEEIARLGADVQYVYTDLSPAFLQHGKKQFGSSGVSLECRLLDIERAPEDQGYSLGHYDAVIATNVLHATREIDRTLQHARSLLRTGGWLWLNELTQTQSFITLTFGLLDGWWAYTDKEVRLPYSPLLDLTGWESALRRAGFGRTRVLTESGRSKQDILLAENTTPHWLAPTAKATPVEKVAPVLPPTAPPARSTPVPAKRPATTQGGIEQTVVSSVREVLQIDAREEIDRRAAFTDLGVDSILAVEIINRINGALRIELRTTDIYNYASVEKLVAHIGELVADLPPNVESFSQSSVAPTNGSPLLLPTSLGLNAPGANESTPDVLGLFQALSRGEMDEESATEMLKNV